jgi:hypothetical protein
MTSAIDKKLAVRRKKADSDFEHLSKWCNHFWNIAWKHPITHITIFVFVCFGFYQEWNFKNMISVSFSHGITAIITSLTQYLFFERKNNND